MSPRHAIEREHAGFRCPECHQQRSEVIRVETNQEGTRIRRRHECLHCGTRFTSFATIDPRRTATGSVARFV